jgi:hypothetical protein
VVEIGRTIIDDVVELAEDLEAHRAEESGPGSQAPEENLIGDLCLDRRAGPAEVFGQCLLHGPRVRERPGLVGVAQDPDVDDRVAQRRADRVLRSLVAGHR